MGGVVTVAGGGAAGPVQPWIPTAAVTLQGADGIALALNVIASSAPEALHLSGLARAEVESIVVTNGTGITVGSTNKCEVFCVDDEQVCNYE